MKGATQDPRDNFNCDFRSDTGLAKSDRDLLTSTWGVAMIFEVTNASSGVRYVDPALYLARKKVERKGCPNSVRPRPR